MITREADYCVRAMLYLSQPENSERSITTTELSEAMDIPFRFLRKICPRLVRAGLLDSTKGRGGGLRLARERAAVSLYDVLVAVDPRGIHLNACLDASQPVPCNRQPQCPVHPRLEGLQARLESLLREVTFDQFDEPAAGR